MNRYPIITKKILKIAKCILERTCIMTEILSRGRMRVQETAPGGYNVHANL